MRNREKMKLTVFWDVVQYSLVDIYQSFGGKAASMICTGVKQTPRKWYG
jgi:hypothetical protein